MLKDGILEHMILVFFLFFLIIFLLFLLLFKFCITINILAENNNIIEISIKLFKFIKYSFYIKINNDFPKFKIEYKRNNKYKTIFEIKRKTSKRKVKKIKNYMPILSNIDFNKLDIKLKLGFKDAYQTSMICGYINIFFYSAFSIIKQKNNRIDCEYNLTPVFDYPIFNISINCIICFRLANIIYEFIKIKRR